MMMAIIMWWINWFLQWHTGVDACCCHNYEWNTMKSTTHIRSSQSVSAWTSITFTEIAWHTLHKYLDRVPSDKKCTLFSATKLSGASGTCQMKGPWYAEVLRMTIYHIPKDAKRSLHRHEKQDALVLRSSTPAPSTNKEPLYSVARLTNGDIYGRLSFCMKMRGWHLIASQDRQLAANQLSCLLPKDSWDILQHARDPSGDKWCRERMDALNVILWARDFYTHTHTHTREVIPGKSTLMKNSHLTTDIHRQELLWQRDHQANWWKN